MPKLDLSCGLTEFQVSSIKFHVKAKIGTLLPLLPDPIEMMLFMQGRYAWRYNWELIDQDAEDKLHPVIVDVDINLKKEFIQFLECTHYKYRCKLEMQPDKYSPLKYVRKIKA